MTRIKISYLAASSLLLLGGGSLFAQDTLTLLNPPNTGGANAGGVYTSPYQIGVNSTTVGTALVCDDYLNDISVGESWQANATTLTTLTSTNITPLLFGDPSATPPSQPPATSYYYPSNSLAEDYAVDAVLTAQLMTLPQGFNSTQAENISYAIWNVFDSNAGNPLGGALTYLSAAETLVLNAAAANGSVDLNNISINGNSIESLTVFTPVIPVPNGNQGGASVQQEFLQVSMPEPAYPAVLALDLLAVAGLVAFFRRRRFLGMNK